MTLRSALAATTLWTRWCAFLQPRTWRTVAPCPPRTGNWPNARDGFGWPPRIRPRLLDNVSLLMLARLRCPRERGVASGRRYGPRLIRGAPGLARRTRSSTQATAGGPALSGASPAVPSDLPALRRARGERISRLQGVQDRVPPGTLLPPPIAIECRPGRPR